MGSYYYLAATLPSLMYGQHPPMSSESFREMARPVLEGPDADIFEQLDLDPGVEAVRSSMDDSSPAYADAAPASGCEFVDAWREWERCLRLNLARHRAQKAKREGSAPVEPPLYPAEAAQAAARAMAAADNPLEAEIALDKARWEAIDTLQGIDYFDRNTVFAYLLRLKLLERRAFFDNDAGLAEYKSLYASILEDVEPGVLPGGDNK